MFNNIIKQVAKSKFLNLLKDKSSMFNDIIKQVVNSS